MHVYIVTEIQVFDSAKGPTLIRNFCVLHVKLGVGNFLRQVINSYINSLRTPIMPCAN